MKGRLLGSVSICVAVALAMAAVALAAYPWKGKTFAATVHGQSVILSVAKNGKSAKVTIEREPHFCTNAGGFPPVTGKLHSAVVTSKGAFSETITFIRSKSVFAKGGEVDGHVTVKGSFSKAKFTGTLKTTYASGGSCGGKTSFVAKPAAAL